MNFEGGSDSFETSEFVSGKLGIMQGEPRFAERNGCHAGVPGLPTLYPPRSHQANQKFKGEILIFSGGRAFAQTPTIVRLEAKLLEEHGMTCSLVDLLSVQIEETK